MPSIVCFSDSKPGSNTEAIFDLIKGVPGIEAHFVEAKKVVSGGKITKIDIAITNNLRCLFGNKYFITVNTQHGNFFLGDTSDEATVDIYPVASDSERQMMLANGVSDKKIRITGCARTDRLFRHVQSTDNCALRTFYNTYNVSPGQEVFLYAPTYDRENLGFGSKGFFASSKSPEDDIKIASKLAGYISAINAKLIIRVHKYYKKKWDNLVPDYLAPIFRKINAPITSNETHPDSIPVIVGSDYLITDFSSIVADFLPMRKPIVFIEPNDAWIYTDKWHAPKKCRQDIGPVIYDSRTIETALELVRHSYCRAYSESCEPYIKQYVPMFDGNCTKRNLQVILEAYNEK